MNINTLETEGLVNFPYPAELRSAVLVAQDSWKKFCELPLEIKQSFAYSSDSAGVGYEVKDGSGNKGDIKENFDVAAGGTEWLESCLAKAKSEIARKFVHNALTLVKVMIPFVVEFAGESEKAFGMAGFEAEIEKGSDAFFVRFIHYPPQKVSGEQTAQAHPDQSGFTLHLFESAPGLECLTYGGEWIPMPVSRDETVIIPAMQMQLRSQGRLQALWHRVVATSDTAQSGRYSAVSFIQFKDTPKYDKDTQGRLQEKPVGFNYGMPHHEFAKLFR